MTEKPARRLAYGSGAFKWYVAVATYYVDLLRRPDDRSALRANVLDAAVLAGTASASLYCDGVFVPTLVVIAAVHLDLEGSLAAGRKILHADLLGQPFCCVFGQGRYRPAIPVVMYFWLPEDSIELRVRRDHVPYDVWAKQGLVFTTEGNVIHYGYIEEFIEELGMKYNIREIAFDRWSAVQMTQNLEGLGFTVVPFGQGYKDMSPPTKELLKLTLEGKLAHGGHLVLRWMIDNVTIRSDPAGNIKADKEKSTEKIDGAIATIMALDRAIRHEGGQRLCL